MSLEDLTGFLAAHEGVGTRALHSPATSANSPSRADVDEFRAVLLAALGQPGMFAVVNFDRALLKVCERCLSCVALHIYRYTVHT